jgi:hypothetical protein
VICKKKTHMQRISHRPNTYLSPIAPKESTLKSTQNRQLNLHEKPFTNSFFLPQETLVFGYWVFVTVIKQWILKSLLDELGVVTQNSSCGRSSLEKEKNEHTSRALFHRQGAYRMDIKSAGDLVKLCYPLLPR